MYKFITFIFPWLVVYGLSTYISIYWYKSVPHKQYIQPKSKFVFYFLAGTKRGRSANHEDFYGRITYIGILGHLISLLAFCFDLKTLINSNEYSNDFSMGYLIYYAIFCIAVSIIGEAQYYFHIKKVVLPNQLVFDDNNLKNSNEDIKSLKSFAEYIFKSRPVKVIVDDSNIYYVKTLNEMHKTKGRFYLHIDKKGNYIGVQTDENFNLFSTYTIFYK